MKARLLRKILNDTGYTISNHDEYIAVGSSLCHDLLSVNKATLNLKYALDTFKEGRKSIKGGELEFIWDKLVDLIATGEIKDIIEGKDVIETPLPVFSVVKGKLVESITDKYGWPNTDDDGIMMYENTHFPTKEQAIEKGISDYKISENYCSDNVKDAEDRLVKAKETVEKYQGWITDLETLKNKK